MHFAELSQTAPAAEGPEETGGDWQRVEGRVRHGTSRTTTKNSFRSTAPAALSPNPQLDILWILNPFSAVNSSKNLIRQVQGWSKFFLAKDKDSRPNYDLFPASGGLLMWGICEVSTATKLLWNMQGQPHQWGVETTEARGDDHFIYPDKTFAAFLLALADRTQEGYSFGEGPCRFLTVDQVVEDRERAK